MNLGPDCHCIRHVLLLKNKNLSHKPISFVNNIPTIIQIKNEQNMGDETILNKINN